MGMIFRLEAKNNPLYLDIDAYWCIENIEINVQRGLVLFEFNAYPSRESRKVENMEIVPSLPFGGPSYPFFHNMLYGWNQKYRLKDIFPDGIPGNVGVIKDVLYRWVKKDLESFGIRYWEDINEF